LEGSYTVTLEVQRRFPQETLTDQGPLPLEVQRPPDSARIDVLDRLITDRRLARTWNHLPPNEQELAVLLRFLLDTRIGFNPKLQEATRDAKRISNEVAELADDLAQKLHLLEIRVKEHDYVCSSELLNPTCLLIAAGARVDPELKSPSMPQILKALAEIAREHPPCPVPSDLNHYADRRQQKAKDGQHNKRTIIAYFDQCRSQHERLRKNYHYPPLPRLQLADEARLLTTLFERDFTSKDISNARSDPHAP